LLSVRTYGAETPKQKHWNTSDGVERGIGSLRASDTAIINELRDGFGRVESRLDQIYNHIDGFIKLHETLDIELKVIKSR